MATADRSNFVGVDITRATPRQPPSRNPYQPVGDFLSNISRFQVIESTLREGEQYGCQIHAPFSWLTF
jgi:homocitrate synthase